MHIVVLDTEPRTRTPQRIVAPELPRHRDHLAVALAASLMLALVGALAIIMLPAPSNNVRYLEAARAIRTRALDERERRIAFDPIVLPPSVSPKKRAVVPLQPSDDDLIGEGFDDGLDREDDAFRALSRERQRREQEEREARVADWEASDAPEPAQSVVLAPHALHESVGEAFLGVDIDDSPLPRAPMPRRERPPPRAPSTKVVPGAGAEPEFICRLPDRDAVRAWFEERVRPVLSDCMTQHMPSTEVRGAVTLSFDERGRVKQAKITDVGDAFVACAEPKLAALAHPDAFELTFTWPFVLSP